MKSTSLPRCLLAFTAACLALNTTTVSGDPPAWWTSPDAEGRKVVDPSVPDSNPKGPANIGQAKWMAKRALDALAPIDPTLADAIRQKLTAPQPNPVNPEGPQLPPILNLDIPDPLPADWTQSQHAPLLIGQLKAIAAPFYDALHTAAPQWLDHESANDAEKGQLQLNGTKDPDPNHPEHFYPWTYVGSDDQNKAIATIGQLKAVFSLRFDADADSNGLPNLWETIQFGHTGNDATLDADSDGLTNAEECLHGTNPNLADSDDDGLTDSEEIDSSSNPRLPRIQLFRETNNPDGTVTFTWVSYAKIGDWFHIENQQQDGTWKTIYATTYGSARLPFVTGATAYSLTLNPETDYLP